MLSIQIGASIPPRSIEVTVVSVEVSRRVEVTGGVEVSVLVKLPGPVRVVVIEVHEVRVHRREVCEP